MLRTAVLTLLNMLRSTLRVLVGRKGMHSVLSAYTWNQGVKHTAYIIVTCTVRVPLV